MGHFDIIYLCTLWGKCILFKGGICSTTSTTQYLLYLISTVDLVSATYLFDVFITIIIATTTTSNNNNNSDNTNNNNNNNNTIILCIHSLRDFGGFVEDNIAPKGPPIYRGNSSSVLDSEQRSDIIISTPYQIKCKSMHAMK